MLRVGDLSCSVPGKFADLCGLDRTYISGVERGVRDVSLRNIERIANALGVSMSRLFAEVK